MISVINRFVNHVFVRQCLRQNSCSVRCLTTQNSDLSAMDDKELQFEELTVETFKELVTNDTIGNKIEIILNEYEYEKYTTLRVPITITTNQMRDLLSLDNPLDRKRWFSYLHKRQKARQKTNDKRREHTVEFWAQKSQKYSPNEPRTGFWDQNGQLIYGLWHNSLFTKIPLTIIRRYYIHRLRTAAMFGQKLVIDMDFDQYMKLAECRQLVKQIQLLYNYNRYQTVQPFDLYFTNCKPEMPSMKTIPQILPNYNTPSFMAQFHQQSYIDLFPKDRLVYLTPHSNTALKTYNADDIYIIGGIIDKTYHEPVSLIKAEKEGIRTARLPIDEYILWGCGSKYLCLNHMVQILHDVNIGHNWVNALKDNIPKRKQKSVEEIDYEDRLRRQNYVIT
ncbi:mitochondrial ribonuclease P protein 1 homolog [Oppia nitens]|uniref:mitochondrial ribonuclease P protein 1 homolog n=1 Tax=Oppia nitens TaxID=1686743 RepID=UPI0023DA5991|nr:mitochondrial ribonuclease P protein 1 homolog [Oppia nitens]